MYAVIVIEGSEHIAMELSTSINVLFDREKPLVTHMLERLSRAGFRVLDFNFCDWIFEGSPFLDRGWEGWLDNVRKRADELGLRFTQGHGPIFNKFGDPDKVEYFTALSYRCLEGAALLGVKWVVFELETAPGAYDMAHESLLRTRNMEWIKKLLDVAEQVGVGIAIENSADVGARDFRRAYGSTPRELIDLVDTLDHPLVGICWDTGHAQIQRLDQGKALRALGDRLKATHIQDNDGNTDQHLLPFCGKVDWKAVVEALYEIDYQGDFTYEVHNFIRPLPDGIRDLALRYAVELGRRLIGGEVWEGKIDG